MTVEFRLLGPLEARRDGAVVSLGGRRQRSVLAALLLRSNEVAGTGYLAEAIWETPPAAPESNIRTYVAGLRRALRGVGESDDRIATRSGGYLLAVRPGELDLAVFEEHAREGEHAVRRRDFTRAVDHLERALALWRGRPLEGSTLGTLLAAEADRIEDRRLAVVEQHAQAWIALGRPDLVIGGLRALVAEHPYREELWAQLMLALYHGDRQADALAAFTQVRQRLVTDLGIEPGPRLQRLHQEILSVEPIEAGVRDGSAHADDAVSVARAYRQLPMDIVEFTGRTAELTRMLRIVEEHGDPAATAVPVIAIEGMAGVGKTRLAVHAAHRIVGQGRFDEMQLWTDLHGFDPEHPPADPAEVLAGFLRLLGVPGQHIPHGLDARAALYRDRLVGRRVLVLLDNAATEEQVRPLLPGTADCLVLITTRRRLSGLDGTRPLPLGVLGTAEAVALLAHIAGDGRVEAEPTAARRVVELCGGLPLAVVLAARRLRNRPSWTVGDLVERLADAERRLARLSAGALGVHVIFDLSYRALPPRHRRLFRLLGVHPGDDITAHTAAALGDLHPDDAESLLEDLLDEHLLHQSTPGRYHFHDLLRSFARERAHAEESASDRDGAVTRLLSWYLHAAEGARRLLEPHRGQPVRLHPLLTRHPVPVPADHEQALAWCEAERGGLLAAVHAALEIEQLSIAWQLPSILLNFYYRRSHWADWLTTHRIALKAARALDEQHGQGLIWRGLGIAQHDLRHFTEAVDCYQRAQRILDTVGDRNGQAWNLNNLGIGYIDLERLDDARGCFAAALPGFRETGDRQGEGICLSNLGDTLRRLGLRAEATAHLQEALHIQHDMTDQASLRFTLTCLGDLLHDGGDWAEAARHHREAVVVSERVGDQRMVARALIGLARALEATGDTDTALRHRRRALVIFDELGDPQAEVLRPLLGRPPIDRSEHQGTSDDP
ncbi:DNA-binding SARP family transcriptional activator/tetratricopeptide (TPR) repeat protein [Actinoalloteichus hoggarensis]|uniref:Regulatory protein AfsR n=1 Tax=Actinoalloteichus hoggarensis TaxID=1470176 RepID=A0A221W607_9PSEU|nr:BTAD domain-containing putative transcriptional regulator [Actinoalloteichus hoggarensis]ASO20887.1 Regulatory protein AfsR [Actinoalloteichus hoggarensis]MBB5920818.1 DNA-binding SARP family transcriptional activator/tetratricopeptide (TPR) repeat protein [Actinoalloteichus hoggarensis]